MYKILCSLLLLHGAAALDAAVFQFSVPVPTAAGTHRAWLWVPPAAPQVRGVVLAGMTLMERELVKDEAIRRACADEHLAILFLNCGLSAPDLLQVLGDLAAVSGYAELDRAPLFFVGHSAGGPQAKNRALQFASRCFGVVLYRGGAPGGSHAVPPGIPALMMLGQYDEFGGVMRAQDGRESWENGRDALAAFRAAHEHNLGSLVIEPGAGHFAWSDRNAAYLALFLRKAARAGLTAGGQMRAIDPRSGWLTELPSRAPPRYPAAPYDAYTGPRTNAAWHFDEEMARATMAYHVGLTGKQDQFIRWDDPVWVDAGARFFFTQLKWVGDGQTFEVYPVYADHYPGLHDGKGPRWPKAGRPASHSDAPIRVKPVSGPLVAAGTNRLRIQYDGLAPATEPLRCTFMAFSEGDATHRYTEQVGMTPRGFNGLKSGRPQTLSFPQLPNLKTDSPPLKLTATSDAGLPVEFYVMYGPAVISNQTLRIAELPARARFPVAIRVAAWQLGRGIAPRVQSAPPVEQTLYLESP